MVDPLTSLGYTQAPKERKLENSFTQIVLRPRGILGRVVATCSPSLHRNFTRFIRYRHLPWETVTTNTIEDGQGINSDGKEVIITIEGVIAKKDLRVETSGLIDDASHLGKIDVEAIIANLTGGDEIALGDTMK